MQDSQSSTDWTR